MTINDSREALLSDPMYLGRMIAFWSHRNDVLGLPAIEHDPTKIDLLDGYKRELGESGEMIMISAVADTLYQAVQIKKKRVTEIITLIRGGKVEIERARTLLHEADIIKGEIEEMTAALQNINEGLNRGS